MHGASAIVSAFVGSGTDGFLPRPDAYLGVNTQSPPRVSSITN